MYACTENMYNIKYNPKVIPCQKDILLKSHSTTQCVPKDTTLQLVVGGNGWVMEISILTPLTGFVNSDMEPSQGLAGEGRGASSSRNSIMVPKCEIFGLLDSCDLYTIKPLWVIDFGTGKINYFVQRLGLIEKDHQIGRS